MAHQVSRRGLARLGAFGLLALPLAGCVGQAYPVQPAPAFRRYELAADVLFDFNSATLRPEASAALSGILSQMRQTFPYPRIQVEGHTDSVGTDAYNDRLSLARAEAVRDWLMANGIPPNAITTRGLGKRQPLAPNAFPDGRDNPEGRARNRRVVLIASPM